MTNAAGQNRPFKFGARDRKEFIVEDSEVAIRCINDSDGNIIFYGRAKAGTLESEDKWQLRYITYDSNNSVLSQTWPQDSDGNASSDYEFIWKSNANLTITNISQANPAVVTVSSAGSLANGDQIIIQSVSGMSEVNFDGTNVYTVANLSGTQFELQGVDSSAYSAYSTGGTVSYSGVVNYTYS